MMDSMSDASNDVGHHMNNSMMHDMLNHTMNPPGQHHDHHVMPTIEHDSHDHMMMDHSSHDMMDHSSHDMMGMGNSSHDMDMMHHDGTHNMYFSFGFPRVLVLEGWTVTSIVELVVSLLGLCLIAIFMESITRLTKRASSKTLCFMAKKNLKTSECVKKMKSNYRKLSTNIDTGQNDKVAGMKSKQDNDHDEAAPEVEMTLLNTDENKNKDVKKTITTETDVPLTLPQCLQYRLLLTFLHVIRVLLGYFLMLSIMTYNWWILIVILSGSAIGYLFFGWGHINTLDQIASSTLPPDIVAKSTLEDELELNERVCLQSQDGSCDVIETHNGYSLVEEDATQENKESGTLWKSGPENPPKYSSDPGFGKVDIRINLQADIISQSEFTERFQNSKETDL
ncbi:uncharacterized protein [Amphiura filiformis]|uniref:uncharacterized protein n=1 Tax=Amphiura filiformis TaxID=82378 RepID=UPI003B20C05A